MGTKVHCESLLISGYNSMRDLNKESSSCRWPLFYNDNKSSANDQCYNNGLQITQDTYLGYDKDSVKRIMLEHESVFKAQVLELHRVYRIQKDMMEDLKRKQWIPSSHDDIRKWKVPSFPLVNSVYDRPTLSVVEDNGHSPMKVGGNGLIASQNGASSKNVELLDVRPTKIRKKMIDLHLPADEYIDTEEILEFKDYRVRGKSSSHLPNGLADLNEPIKGQESNELGAVLGQNREDRKTKPSLSHVPMISLQSDGNKSSKAWHPQILRTDHYTDTHKSAASSSSFLQPVKALNSSQSSQVLMNSSQKVMGLSHSGQNKAVLWRERTFIDLEAETSNHEVSYPRHVYPCNPPDSAVPWNHLQAPSFGFPQKVEASGPRYPVLNLSDTVNGKKQQGCFGDRLQFESNSRFNIACGSSSRSDQNMFYTESSSSSKKNQLNFSGGSYVYPNGGHDYMSGNPLMDSNGSREMKFARDLNLNVKASNSSVVKVRKNGEHIATLPWLKPKSTCNTENLKADSVLSPKINSLDIKDDPQNKAQNPKWPESLKTDSCSNKGNIRMLDINEPCDDPTGSEEDEQIEDQTGTKVVASTRCEIDLNMSVSEEEDWSVPISLKLNAKTPMIDLEAPAVPESDEENDEISGEKLDEETQKLPEFEKIAAETIVALASACLDRELEAVVASPSSSSENILHWFAETVDGYSLNKKLDKAKNGSSSSREEIDSFESMTLQLPEITEDEYMPKPLVPEDLKFEETSGTTLFTSQRPRRGNARKGKQRRDFQRDILPGLLSLSKHEVTEDIHMFDGFMRATGSTWTPSLARRKTGSTRGRPRRVITTATTTLPTQPVPEQPVYCPVVTPSQELNNHYINNGNNIEMGGLEDRSFAGWGKMTRRPRRQRCPPATPTASNRTSPQAPFT